MIARSLRVTFRRGQPLAGYLQLQSSAARAVRTRAAGHGLRVHYDVAGAPVGIEITCPRVQLSHVNALLDMLGVTRVDASELAPLLDR
jgi:hypothetical protein